MGDEFKHIIPNFFFFFKNRPNFKMFTLISICTISGDEPPEWLLLISNALSSSKARNCKIIMSGWVGDAIHATILPHVVHLQYISIFF